MNVYRIVYGSVKYAYIMASNIEEAINIFKKHKNDNITDIGLTCTNLIYDVSKIAKDAYLEGYKEGKYTFFNDINMLYDKLK